MHRFLITLILVGLFAGSGISAYKFGFLRGHARGEGEQYMRSIAFDLSQDRALLALHARDGGSQTLGKAIHDEASGDFFTGLDLIKKYPEVSEDLIKELEESLQKIRPLIQESQSYKFLEKSREQGEGSGELH